MLIGLAVLSRADIPAPAHYFPLDGTLPSVVGVMPVNGTGVFGPGQPGFGLASTTPSNTLRGPDDTHGNMLPNDGNWTLSFWTRFRYDATLTTPFRLFSKGGRSDNASEAPGLQMYQREFINTRNFSIFFGRTNAIAREGFDVPSWKASFNTNGWNHVALVRNGGALYLYLNSSNLTLCALNSLTPANTLAGGATGNYGVNSSTLNRALQLSPEITGPTNWGLDDVATWTNALTAAQVATLFTQGTNGVPLSGLAIIPAYETVQSGAWETASTWRVAPVAASASFVRHNVAASSALPNLFTLAVQSNATLSLGASSSFAVTKTGEDCLRVGHAATGGLALTSGAALSATGLSNIGSEILGNGSLTVDAATLYSGEGLRIGHLGGNGAAVVRNGATLTTRLLLYVGNDTNALGQAGTGTLTVDHATVNVTNDWFSAGRYGGNGTLILTNSAVFNKSGANHIEFGNRKDCVSRLVMSGSTLNASNAPLTEIMIGKAGSRSTVSLTDSTINMGSLLNVGHQDGAYVEATLVRSAIRKTDHANNYLQFSSDGSATSSVTLINSTLSITRSAGTGSSGILFGPGNASLCALTNTDSTIELISTNGSRIVLAAGTGACVNYLQQGDSARMVSADDLRLGDGSASTTSYRQLGGKTLAGQYLWLAPSATASADFTLSGGTLSARGVSGGTGAGGRLIFDGGTYAAATNADAVFASGNVQMLFNAGKQATFDTAGKTLAVLPYHAPKGAGGLTKQGAGTLRMPGTYTGYTSVEAGTLALYSASVSTGYAVADGATLLFDGMTNAAVSATAFALNGTLTFGADAAGLTMARLTLTGATVSVGANAKIAFPSGIALLPGKSFTFLDTGDAALGARALSAVNVPAGWMVTQSGTLYTLQQVIPALPPLGRDDIVVWLSRETIAALPANQRSYQVGAFVGTGLIVSNAPRNDLLAQVQAVYFNGAADQAMHGPSAPYGIVSNNTWSASMWVWSGNRANHEPTVVCWGMRKGLNKQNCSLNHASTEARAASFFGNDPKYTAGAPALDSWQHIVYSYDGSVTGQGLKVYVNGEPRTLDIDNNSLIIPNDGQSILLGNQHNDTPQSIVPSPGRPYEGFLGELVIFDNTLTQAEAAQLYTNGMPTFVGSTSLPDTDQVFESASYRNWTDAAGWRNGAVPYGNSALVTGSGVSADVAGAVPSFKNLRVEAGAAVHVNGATFRPDGIVAVSNNAAFTIAGGGLLDPAGHVYIAGGSSLLISGVGSKLYVQALNNPLRIGNETAALSTLAVTDSGNVEVRNSSLQVSYNTDTASGNAALVLSNATVTVGSATVGGNVYVGFQSGTGTLTAVNSAINVINGQIRISSSWNNGTSQAGMLLDNTALTLSGGMYLAFCENEMYYRSKNVVSPLIIRNKSSVAVPGEFILGNRNAASDFNQPMAANAPSVLVLDDSTLTLGSWASVARQNGLGTLIITNNALVIKQLYNHFRIGAEGNATANQGANTNPYTEGRVHVSAGGVLDIQPTTNQLILAAAATDRGVLTISEGGTVKANTVTGSGTRGALVFDGGTLQARSSVTNFVVCAVPLLVTDGKQAIIDTQAYSVTIPCAFGGAGGLLKRGTGALTLSALSTNIGPVTVEQGTLLLPSGSGVGGTLTIPATNAVTVQIGTSNVADTVSLGGLHLMKNLPFDLTAPGVSDKLIFTTVAGCTAETGTGLTLVYNPTLTATLFDKTVHYLIAQAPSGCVKAPVITNLPQGWFVATQPSGNTVNYVLTGKLGSLILLK